MGNCFMRAEDVARELGISESYAYKIMRMLNNELKAKGMIVISGRVSRRYFEERCMYGNIGKSEREDAH